MTATVSKAAASSKAAMRDVPFDWADPFRIDALLSDEERMIRDTARAYAQQRLAPRIVDANRHETFDVSVMKEMAELGFLGAPTTSRFRSMERRFIGQAPCIVLCANKVNTFSTTSRFALARTNEKWNRNLCFVPQRPGPANFS